MRHFSPSVFTPQSGRSADKERNESWKTWKIPFIDEAYKVDASVLNCGSFSVCSNEKVPTSTHREPQKEQFSKPHECGPLKSALNRQTNGGLFFSRLHQRSLNNLKANLADKNPTILINSRHFWPIAHLLIVIRIRSAKFYKMVG